MRIFIICSKAFYDRIPPIQKELECHGHTIMLPNCFDDPGMENRMRALGAKEHATWKAEKIAESTEKIRENDAVLVLNFEKHGVPRYIGGATFLEMYDAFRMGKSVYLWDAIPEGILHDEIVGFHPIIIHGDVSKIKE